MGEILISYFLWYITQWIRLSPGDRTTGSLNRSSAGSIMNSQGEDFIPLGVQRLVDRVCLQTVVTQLHSAERVALSWNTGMHSKAFRFKYPREIWKWNVICNVSNKSLYCCNAVSCPIVDGLSLVCDVSQPCSLFLSSSYTTGQTFGVSKDA